MSKQRWTAIPAARSSAAVLKIRLWALLGVLLIAAVLGPLSFFRAGNIEIPEVDLEDAKPKAAAEAATVALDFLAGRESAIPMALGLPQGFAPEERDEQSPASGLDIVSFTVGEWNSETWAGRELEFHRFNVVTTEGELLTVTVPMILHRGGPVLGSYPSLTQTPLSNPEGAGPADYSDFTTNKGAATDSVIAIVDRWVAAYVADDADTLSTIVADPDAETGSYRGLGGWALHGDEGVRVLSVIPTDGGDFLRIRFWMSAERANGFTTSTEMDILVTGSETQTPRVVAWGPVGSGPTLTPYINNIGTGP